MDLSLSLRLSGIPLNSELQLVADEKKKKAGNQGVNISVQFGDRQRRTGDFSSTQTLLAVIETLFAADCPEVSDDQLLLSINYLNRQFEGREVLAATTLKLMGITSGRQLLRLHARPKDAKVEQKFTENFKFKTPVPIKTATENVVASKTEEVHKVEKNLDKKEEEKGSSLPETKHIEEKHQPVDLSQKPPSTSSAAVQGKSLLEQFKAMKEDARKNKGSALSSSGPIMTTTVNADSLKEVKYVRNRIKLSVLELNSFLFCSSAAITRRYCTRLPRRPPLSSSRRRMTFTSTLSAT